MLNIGAATVGSEYIGAGIHCGRVKSETKSLLFGIETCEKKPHFEQPIHRYGQQRLREDVWWRQ